VTVLEFDSLAVLHPPLASIVVHLDVADADAFAGSNAAADDAVLLHHLRGSGRRAHRVGTFSRHRPPEKKKWISIGVMGSAAPVSGVRAALADEH
jgi:hypothetical protein